LGPGSRSTHHLAWPVLKSGQLQSWQRRGKVLMLLPESAIF
jgi:hypothetical protein